MTATGHHVTPLLCVCVCVCVCVELASDGLKGRVFEVSLADLQNDEQSFRKFRLISEDVQGKNVLTNFHGMTMTTDKLRSLVKKWQVRKLHSYWIGLLECSYF